MHLLRHTAALLLVVAYAPIVSGPTPIGTEAPPPPPNFLLVDGRPVSLDAPTILLPAGTAVSLKVANDAAASNALALPSQEAVPDLILERRERIRFTDGSSSGTFIPVGDSAAEWRLGAPDPAPVTLTVARTRELSAAAAATADSPALADEEGSVVLTVLPAVPFDRSGDGLLLGTNMGFYPNEKGDGAPASVRDNVGLYAPPRDFYRIDTSSAGLRVTSRFTLGELNPAPFPDAGDGKGRFVAVSPRLVRFLATFEERLSAKGIDPSKLKVLRGFTSPAERQRLDASGVKLAEFTRYQYGDAVALVCEGQEIQALADEAKATMDALGTFGGVGVCSKFEGPGAAKGTPYLHVDLRGWYVGFRE